MNSPNESNHRLESFLTGCLVFGIPLFGMSVGFATAAFWWKLSWGYTFLISVLGLALVLTTVYLAIENDFSDPGIGSLILSLPLFGTLLVFLVTAFWWRLHWSHSVLGSLTVFTSTVIAVRWWEGSQRLARESQQQKETEAFQNWLDRHSDPVFGRPPYSRPQDLPGKPPEWSGLVQVAPEHSTWPTVKVYLAPTGFTQAQRDIYLHITQDFAGFLAPYRDNIEQAYREQCREADERDLFIEAFWNEITIGQDIDGKIETLSINVAYECDEADEHEYKCFGISFRFGELDEISFGYCVC